MSRRSIAMGLAAFIGCLVSAISASAAPIQFSWQFEIPEIQLVGSGLVRFDTDDVVGGRVVAGRMSSVVTSPFESTPNYEFDLPVLLDPSNPAAGDHLGFAYDSISGVGAFSTVYNPGFAIQTIVIPNQLGCFSPFTSCVTVLGNTGFVKQVDGSMNIRVQVLASGAGNQGYVFEAPVIVTVPEPSTVTLMLFGLVGLSLSRGRAPRVQESMAEPGGGL